MQGSSIGIECNKIFLSKYMLYYYTDVGIVLIILLETIAENIV